MSRGRHTAAEERMTQQLQNDPNFLEHVAQSNYGMSAVDLEHSLRCLIDITQNRLPSGKSLEWAYASAGQQYGWSKERVFERLNGIREGTMHSPDDMTLNEGQDRDYGYRSLANGLTSEMTLIEHMQLF